MSADSLLLRRSVIQARLCTGGNSTQPSFFVKGKNKILLQLNFNLRAIQDKKKILGGVDEMIQMECCCDVPKYHSAVKNICMQIN